MLHVYGEPASQTVLDAYRRRQRTWWHLMLTQAAATSWRASTTRGHAGPARPRVAQGRRQPDGTAPRARAIGRGEDRRLRPPFVDSTRLAVWGWSGGGSSTCTSNVPRTDADRRRHGGRAGGNVHNYDTIYQESVRRAAEHDEAASPDASPLYYAEGLRGDLLVHGRRRRSNVTISSTEQLINALVAANKPFTDDGIPNRTHGRSSRARARRHPVRPADAFLNEHIPSGPR